jgi:hypothetical protein
MTDPINDEPLEEIAKQIGENLRVPATMPREIKWPESILPLKRPESDDRPTIVARGAIAGPKNEDVPRAGELSSQVFNDLTLRITTELQETGASQVNDIVNRRSHAQMQMEQYKAEMDKLFAEYEAYAKKHQEKLNNLAEAMRKKVEEETKGMIALSQRLREFADSVNTAHERFFNENEHPRP